MFLTWGIPRKWDYRKLENQRFKNVNWLLELNVNSPNFLIFSQGKSYLRNASKFVKFSSVQVTLENNHFHCFLPLQERKRIVCWKTYVFLAKLKWVWILTLLQSSLPKAIIEPFWVLFSPSISYRNDYHSLRVAGRITWFSI